MSLVFGLVGCQANKTVQEYGYVFQESTGTNQYIIISGQKSPVNFGETSNQLALKSLQALKPSILYENSSGAQIFVVGDYNNQSHSFRLTQWYIKLPFEELVIEDESQVPHRTHTVARHSLERTDFDSRSGFNPNDPTFDPKAFQKTR